MQRTNFRRSRINRHSYLATLALLVLAGCNMLWDSCLQCPDDEPNCAAEPLVTCPPLQLSWKNPAPQGFTIKGMWGSASDNIWAVTEAGTFMRYDGTSWNSIPNIAKSAQLTALSGSAANNIWAVGHDQTLMWYDGTRWTDALMPDSKINLYGAWATQNDLWVVGKDDMGPLIRHYRTSGINLSSEDEWHSKENYTLRGIWGSSNSDVWAVGDGGILVHYMGALRGKQPSPTTKDLAGIWGISKNDIWAVGSNGTIMKYDGSVWSLEIPAMLISEKLYAVHGTTADNMFAVGEKNTILRRSGGRWEVEADETGEPLNYYAAWDDSGGNWAAGAYGRIISKPSGASTWAAVTSSTGNWRGTSAVWMQPGDDLWIASSMAPLHRLPSTGMLTLPQKEGMAIPSATGLWGTSGDKVFVSSSGAAKLAICTPTDCSDHSASLLGGTPASKVWAASESDLWVVQGPKLSHWNGTSWNSLFDAAHPLLAIWGFASTDIWAAGEAGELAHWDGSAWTEFLSPDTNNFNALWGSGPSDVWAVGDFGAAVHWDGSNWTKNNMGLDSHLMSVSGSGPNDVWATGERLFRWDGAKWSTVFSAPESSPMQVWVQRKCNAWVAAQGGGIVNIH